MIRTTFTAVPRRRALLAAKAAVIGALTAVCGTTLVFAAFLLGQSILSRRHLGVSLGSPHVARAVSYAACYLLIVTLLGVGLGAIIRHTAGAITALTSLTLLVPQLISALPAPWSTRVGEYLPYSAARSATATHPVSGTLPPTPSILACAGYAACALGIALILIDHRDT